MNPRTDVARLIGATGPGGWALAGLFAVTYTVIAPWAGGAFLRSPIGIVALVGMIAAAVILVFPQLSPLPHVAAAGVLVAALLPMATGLWFLAPDGWGGWVTWYIGAASYLAFGLTLRGRFAWAIGVLVGQTIIAMIWTGVTIGDPLVGIDLTYAQLILFGAGTFFAFWLRRTARRIAAFQQTRVRREAAESARSAVDEERERELDAVRSLAGDALERIAAAETTDADRDEHALVEAALRDRIRGRSLAHDPLASAVDDARRRGVRVALLDDVGVDAPGSVRLAVPLARIAERLADTRSDEVTVRLARGAQGDEVSLATAEGERLVFSLRAR